MVERSVTEMLEQGLGFLGELKPDDYTTVNEPHFTASIGGHYRHILEHVEVLLNGLDDGCVNYDSRGRDLTVEQCLETAKAKTTDLLTRWNAISSDRMAESVDVISKVSYNEADSPAVKSSIGREAMFTSIHGVHHFALIKVMCQLRGLEMEGAFGVAPATVAHQEK